MGVDFLTCMNEGCKRTFADCGAFFPCSCGESFCSEECGNRQIEEPETDEYDALYSCNLCRGETILNNDLLKFLLEKYNITYKEAVEMFKAK